MPDKSTDGRSAVIPPIGEAICAPDAHGQAAFLLVESLIHGLRERAVLTVAEAVDIVDTAADVQFDMAAQADGAGPAMHRSAMLLTVVANSLRKDLTVGGGA